MVLNKESSNLEIRFYKCRHIKLTMGSYNAKKNIVDTAQHGVYDENIENMSSRRENIHLSCLCIHHSALNQITFVPNQKLANTVICIPINLIKPLLNIVEAIHLSYIVDNLFN